ncbi:MAG: dipicolinate synthase subunit DpsA [Bacillota bacterium]|nr:dipicolinate synthase subunit DpsA [Bacillota bacterium]
MKKKLRFLVIGGDLRQARLCEMFQDDGHEVSVYALDRQKFENDIMLCSDVRDCALKADCVVLPLPVTHEEGRLNSPLSNSSHKIEDILKMIPAGKLVAGGMVPPKVKALANSYSIRLVDYLHREELAVLNAIPVAEGAIQIAMEETPITIHGSECLVIGNGRIGKILACYLQGLGARVTVSARKCTDFAWIYAFGQEVLDTRLLEGNLSRFDIIFNTVPELVLNEARLLEVKEDCLIIDLASKPGGADQKFG